MLGIVSLLGSIGLVAGLAAAGAGAGDDPLAFDATRFEARTLTVGGQTLAYRAYEGITCVAKPVDARLQSINIYIPAAYFEGKSVGGYTAATAPIFLPNTIGGYMAGPPGRVGAGGRGGQTLDAALAHGYVVAAPGARGLNSQDGSGRYTGKAPACIVDLKAAVRYLRHNQKAMPGDAERIVSNGTSAGGAASALLGATGDSADYEPYLVALGAAKERDDIFAASCYCPITNLDHADAAYEWLFNGVNEYQGRGGGGTMTAEQVQLSGELKRLFPAYVNSLGLKTHDGKALTLNDEGHGTFKDYVKSYVVASAQKAVDGGKDLSDLRWITLDGKTVKDIDFAQYPRFATRMKVTPAFDGALECRLFGTETVDGRHFTAFGRDHSTDHAFADPQVIKMMNPMSYIGAKGVKTAANWRIRHGAADRDTSIAVPIILATKLRNSGSKVDIALPWGVGHSGDYDLPELFAWIDSLCR